MVKKWQSSRNDAPSEPAKRYPATLRKTLSRHYQDIKLAALLPSIAAATRDRFSYRMTKNADNLLRRDHCRLLITGKKFASGEVPFSVSVTRRRPPDGKQRTDRSEPSPGSGDRCVLQLSLLTKIGRSAAGGRRRGAAAVADEPVISERRGRPGYR
jgi:hypothetical protein